MTLAQHDLEAAGVAIRRFEWVPATDRHVLLRVEVSFDHEASDGVVAGIRLIALPGASDEEGSRMAQALRPIQQSLQAISDPAQPRWTFAFAAPRELALRSAATFWLRVADAAVVSLPRPEQRELARRGPSAEAAAPAGEAAAPAEEAPPVERPELAPARRVEPAGRTLPSRLLQVAGFALAGVAIGLLLWGAVLLVQAAVGPASKTSTHRATPSAPIATVVPRGESLVARVRGARVPVYASAGATVPKTMLKNPNPDGAPLAFLAAKRVVRHQAPRLPVLLPTRPNLSRGWVPMRDVTFALDPYRVKVHLRSHVMSVLRRGKVLETDSVGVGRAVTPTPFGVYYITELLKQPDPTGFYGPYAFGISAHSDVEHEFAGGHGEIGIHGTNEPWLIGGDVSHGCIRVRNDVITRLARMLPLGTPVVIAK